MYSSMKEKILRFLKNKFNIALIIIQFLAIIFYALGGVWELAVILFFMLEGAFFVVWGSKILVEIKANTVGQDFMSQLPFTDSEKIEMEKRNQKIQKNNKFLAVVLISIGVVLVFSLISVLF